MWVPWGNQKMNPPVPTSCFSFQLIHTYEEAEEAAPSGESGRVTRPADA